jgi:hypothetical protein
MVRPQYYFRKSDRGLLAWDVRHLIALSANLPIQQVPVSSIVEINENHWYSQRGVEPTCRSIVAHCALMITADLSYPIILDNGGRVMDGMHRVCKALLEGLSHVAAVRFVVDPEPDYVGREPETLPYLG